MDDAEFDRLIAADGLLEWAEYAGNRYGTPRRAAARRGWPPAQPALLEIELQGARQVRARDPEAQLVFLAPPSWARAGQPAGRARLRTAGRAGARGWPSRRPSWTPSGEFDVVVVNDDVARAADELVGLLTAPSPGLVPGE